MADRDGQSQALRIEGACRTRDVDHAKQLAIGRVMNRDSSASPPLHLRAEMLCTVNLDRLRFRYRGANRVGADVGLAPATSVFEMDCAAGVDDPVVALRIDDQPTRIGEDHD
ncbi:hypothetical protein J2R73_007764 [Bradyrhizobium japonicum]|nr:hypothetical protein [Bradyrhizobium japonicum]MCP1862760.1 hypothetical protein [Bradyrhizobium japonicum]MCP1893615.1 hypothetical protein [Bradyrhizobium japonicum]MCW2326729.1 hypothetical protein [Bradyrhizobium japonicum]